MKKDNKYSAFYGAIIILFFVMFYMSPYRLDDWTWGSKVGINHLMNHFHGYNGRYFGNIIVLLLLRIPAVFRATIQVVIMILVFKTIRPIMQHNPLQIVLFLCLFLLMPIGVFAQSISWISGFSNFVLSLLLVTHVFSYAVITNTDVATTWEKKLGNAVIVFLGCLVLETATIYIVCILFTTLVYQRILNGNKSS